MANPNENISIESVIQDYFKGYTGAEAELVAKAFHPETRLYSVDADASEKLDRTELAGWLENLSARNAKGDVRAAEQTISQIDITGSAAVAKVILTFSKFRFTDYLSLLRIEGSWKIIGKIYHFEPLESV